MVVIPEGEFLMGCDNGAKNERPARRVFVDRFAIARRAVTNRLYSQFIDDTKRATPPTIPTSPSRA